MKLVVGLGNVGAQFANTRHNAGFMVVDELAKQLDATPWEHKPKLFAFTATSLVGADKVMLAKPDTMMNVSGKAVRALIDFYKIPLEDVLVVSDDLDLAYGKIRVRQGGSSGGQNGLRSIIDSVGADFVRMRIGIASEDRREHAPSNFVLSSFSDSEAKHLPTIISEATQIVRQLITDGVEHISKTILDN